MSRLTEKSEAKTLLIYWFVPATVVVVSLLGIWYALTAPPVPITNPDVQKYIPEVTDKMLRYARISIATGFGWSIFAIIIYFVFLQSGWAARLRDFVQESSANLLIRVALFTLIYSLVITIVASPFMYLSGFWLPHQFGLSSQPLSDWLLDEGKEFGVDVAIESLLWFLFFFVVTRFPKRWPGILFLVAIPTTLFLTYVHPLVIDPIFNKIEPMPNSALRQEIQGLANRSGLPDAPILVADKSRQTNRINAYVTGIGSSARIVVWDTTINKMQPEQIAGIVAHELGHYRHNHVLWGCLLAMALNLLTVPINMYITPRFFSNCPRAWGVRKVHDIAAIPVFMLVTNCFGFWSEPVMNSYSRHIEHEADMFAVHLHSNADDIARAFAFLARENLSEPNPPRLIALWLYSHPPLAERIDSALRRAASQKLNASTTTHKQ